MNSKTLDEFLTTLKFRMPYIEATTMEILRYSSINPVGGRSPNIDCIINEYFIPKVKLLNKYLCIIGEHFTMRNTSFFCNSGLDSSHFDAQTSFQ